MMCKHTDMLLSRKGSNMADLCVELLSHKCRWYMLLYDRFYARLYGK